MSSDQEEVSHKSVVGEGFHRIEESPILEVEKPTFGSLQLMKRGSAPQTQKLDQLWRLDQGSLPRVLIMSVEKLKVGSHS